MIDRTKSQWIKFNAISVPFFEFSFLNTMPLQTDIQQTSLAFDATHHVVNLSDPAHHLFINSNVINLQGTASSG